MWTPKILALLATYDVAATFCVIGRQTRRYPALMRAEAGEGHHLANHTLSHPLALTGLSPTALRGEVINAQDAIVTAAGVTPQQFRSPGGIWSPDLLRLLAAEWLVPIDGDARPP